MKEILQQLLENECNNLDRDGFSWQTLSASPEEHQGFLRRFQLQSNQKNDSAEEERWGCWNRLWFRRQLQAMIQQVILSIADI